MPLKIVMMGTGQFALPTLLGLYETSHQIVGLVTQPDKGGSGHHQHRNALKQVAEKHNTPVFQPENVNRTASLEPLKALEADICVVASYGQILSRELIDIPRLGTINLHGSVLPKYRGASPVQYAIWNGETETGVTIFQIQPSVDSGPILGVEATEIGADWTSRELLLHLAQIAVPLTIRVLDKLEAGVVQPKKQDPNLVSYAPRLTKADGEIDWNQTADRISCHIRAMQPWPKPYSWLKSLDGRTERLIILGVRSLTSPPPVECLASAEPGQIVYVTRKQVLVQSAEGPIELLKVQPAGKRAMQIHEFLCGHELQIGDEFISSRETIKVGS